MSTGFAVIFIIGKAAIWLALPLAIGIWEWRRHRKMMRSGEAEPAALPRWLQAAPRERTARPMRAAPQRRLPHRPVPVHATAPVSPVASVGATAKAAPAGTPATAAPAAAAEPPAPTSGTAERKAA